MTKQINNSKCKNAQVTEEEWEFEENWLKNLHASPTNANETYGNLIEPNPSMFMVQLIALIFVIDSFVVSCKCMKPSFTRNRWPVPIARIQMVRGVCCSVYSHPLWKWMFFHKNSFQFSSKSALNIFAFLPHPKQKCEILVSAVAMVSLTCHFKSCQFQLLR